MSDILIRTNGHAGHITLNRPRALNALTWDMCLAIEAAIDAWRNDTAVKLIIIDATGDRAFCAGGDIADMYASGQRGDLAYGQKFWQDEYRLNSKIGHYPKPIITFLHGFTMGGGVGIGCHASHRIVCENSRVALPECTIGLVPDVGSTYLLGRAPGYTGTYLGLTGARMSAADAIYAGFADNFVPQSQWEGLKSDLMTHGTVDMIPQVAASPAPLATRQAAINATFSGASLADILSSSLDADTQKMLDRNAPLGMACAVILIDRARKTADLNAALHQEYRFTHRAVAQSDFIEGIRAAIIDKDRAPKWQALTDAAVAQMTAPLAHDPLLLTGENL